MNWRKKTRARPRRAAAASCFVLECLEVRTALATTWGAPQLASFAYAAVEGRSDMNRPEPSLIVESSALASGGIGETVLQIAGQSQALGAANRSFSQTTDSVVIGGGVNESLVSSASLTASGGSLTAPPQLPGGIVVPHSPASASTLDSLGVFAGIRAIELTESAESTMAPGGGPMGSFDMRFADSGLMMILPPEPDEWVGILQGRGVAAANSDDKDTDMSLSGPLLWTDTDTGLLTWMSLTQTAGRSAGRGSSPILAELALQMNPTGEVGGSSGLLYLATGGPSNLLDELSALREGDMLTTDQATAESEQSGSILNAAMPLNILLSSTGVPIPAEQGDVEQIAELIPLSESSLALAATLWTVRSDSQAPAPGSDLAAGAAADPALSSPTPQQWAVFMTGVDRAFEQTFRDVPIDTFGSDGRHKKSEEAKTSLDDGFQWLGPILPGAVEGLRGGKQRSTRPGQSSSLDESSDAGAAMPSSLAISHLTEDERGVATSQKLEVAQPEDSEGQHVVVASMPVLWAVSISSIVAGWCFGKKRERRQRSWRKGENSSSNSFPLA